MQHLLGQPVPGDQRPVGKGRAELSSSPPPSSVPLSPCFQRMGLSHRDPGSKQLFTEGARCPEKGLGVARAAGPRRALTCGRGSSLQRLLPLLLVLLLHHLSGKQQQSRPDVPEPRTMWLCVRSAGCGVGCRWHSLRAAAAARPGLGALAVSSPRPPRPCPPGSLSSLTGGGACDWLQVPKQARAGGTP